MVRFEGEDFGLVLGLEPAALRPPPVPLAFEPAALPPPVLLAFEPAVPSPPPAPLVFAEVLPRLPALGLRADLPVALTGGGFFFSAPSSFMLATPTTSGSPPASHSTIHSVSEPGSWYLGKGLHVGGGMDEGRR